MSRDGGEAEMEAEWDAIEHRTQQAKADVSRDVGVIKAKTDDAFSPVDLQGVQQWISHLEVDPEVLRPMREEIVAGGGSCCGVSQRSRLDVPKLNRKLWADRDLVFFLNLTDFDSNNTMHHRMLLTLYGKLTRNKVCPTIGRHWEVLGFEHADPSLDLNRTGGILNVIHLFFFWAHYSDLLKAIHLLSLNEQQSFPFVCISINFTRMVLETLLTGGLSSLCERGSQQSGERRVFDTVCSVQNGCLCYYYEQWRANKRTDADRQLAFEEVQRLLQKKPAKLLDALSQAVKNRDKGPSLKTDFTDLEQSAAKKGTEHKGVNGQNGSVPERLKGYESSQ